MRLYRVMMVKQVDEEGESWKATMFFDNGTTSTVECDCLEGVCMEALNVKGEEKHERGSGVALEEQAGSMLAKEPTA